MLHADVQTTCKMLLATNINDFVDALSKLFLLKSAD